MKQNHFMYVGSSSLKENIKCKPTYVRWPRVRLNMKAAKQGALSQTACRTACANDKDPAKGTSKLQVYFYVYAFRKEGLLRYFAPELRNMETFNGTDKFSKKHAFPRTLFFS
jgi:hypothetical protein